MTSPHLRSPRHNQALRLTWQRTFRPGGVSWPDGASRFDGIVAKNIRRLAQNETVDLWAMDDVHFQLCRPLVADHFPGKNLPASIIQPP